MKFQHKIFLIIVKIKNKIFKILKIMIMKNL